MALSFESPAGATPLDSDEAAGLIPGHIVNQAQLNEWEHANIIKGELWAFARAGTTELEPGFIRNLHNAMFGETWKWAGTFRTTGKNLGIDAPDIAPALHNLCADVRAQIEAGQVAIDEIAIRFSHRLVSIHPFANGNGRLSRTCADWLLVKQRSKRFTWGMSRNQGGDTVRAAYIDALRAADRGDIKPLLAFARS